MRWFGGFLVAVILPLLLSEFTDWCPWFASQLVRRAARRLPEDARTRWEEEWLEHIEALASRRLSALVRGIWIYVRAPSWGRMLQSLPPASPKALGTPLQEGQVPPIIHRQSFQLPSGSFWPRLYYKYEDSEGVQRLLLKGEKATAFVLRESRESPAEVEAVLYFRNPMCFPSLGDVCCISARQQDLPALVRLVKRTQGLDPMSAEQWRLRVGL
jgi:hypothetical protein